MESYIMHLVYMSCKCNILKISNSYKKASKKSGCQLSYLCIFSYGLLIYLSTCLSRRQQSDHYRDVSQVKSPKDLKIMHQLNFDQNC